MSLEETQARDLAARIAQRLARQEGPAATLGDIAELRAGLSEVLRRLEKLETKAQHPTPNTQHLSLHPSQERFAIEPAVAEMVDYLEGGKRCAFEPGNKPCDNCSMCTARGF
jgi:hypothetical protein